MAAVGSAGDASCACADVALRHRLQRGCVGLSSDPDRDDPDGPSGVVGSLQSRRESPQVDANRIDIRPIRQHRDDVDVSRVVVASDVLEGGPGGVVQPGVATDMGR
jgi:hypothetical protein